MLLLTWHGTILRVEQAQNRLVHAPLVPEDAAALDLAFSDTLPGGMELHPGPHQGAFHIRHGEMTLWARAESPSPEVDAAAPTVEACVLPITEAEAAALRALLSVAHRHADSGVAVPQAILAPGFVLEAGPDNRLDLVAGRPSLTAAGIVLPGGAGVLVRFDAPRGVELVAAEPEGSIAVAGGVEQHFLPFTAAYSGRNWFYGAGGAAPLTGTHQFTGFVRRADDAFVLALDGRRVVFTRHGVLNGGVHGDAAPPYPAGVTSDGARLFVSEAALAAAPVLAGPHVLLPPVSDHPILDAVLALVLLAPHLPPGATLLQPAPAAEWLAAFGFGALRSVPVAASLVGVETLYWADPTDELSAEVALAARNRAYAVQPPPTGRRRIFMTEGLANAARLSEISTVLNYETVDAVPPDPAGRASLFAGAQAVIAASGPLLENVVFCRPGTQVVELSPDSAWNGRYARLSNQLGLLHAVQPCPKEGDALLADLAGFRRLLRILQARP